MNAYPHNLAIIEEFRANSGKVGGRFSGAPLLLLTTTGAKSGQTFTTPLRYRADGDRFTIFASKGGADTHPGWYHNVRANPIVTVEVGAEKFQARASIAEGAERDRLYAAMVAGAPQFGEYQKATSRVIPVVILERIA